MTISPTPLKRWSVFSQKKKSISLKEMEEIMKIMAGEVKKQKTK